MAFEDFYLDPATGDLALNDNGEFKAVEEIRRIGQACRIVCTTHLGEWLLDTSSGIDYINEVFIKNPDENLIRARFYQQLSRVPGVISVDSVTTTPDFSTRTLNIEFSVQTEYGTVKDIING